MRQTTKRPGEERTKKRVMSSDEGKLLGDSGLRFRVIDSNSKTMSTQKGGWRRY
jgi:hypothetical protein